MSAPRRPGARFGGKRKTTGSNAKRAREMALLAELQADHGYMFARIKSERDRHTTQVRGIKSGKLTMTPAYVARVIVPDASWLARQMAEPAPKTKKKGQRP